MQVVAGGLLTALMEAILVTRPHWLTASSVNLLEGAAFLFCCAGVMTGGRKVRTAFEALGNDKDAARRDETFMRSRTRVRIVAFVAVAAVGVLAANRFNFDPVYGLIGAALLGISAPLIDRARGWGSVNPDTRH